MFRNPSSQKQRKGEGKEERESIFLPCAATRKKKGGPSNRIDKCLRKGRKENAFLTSRRERDRFKTKQGRGIQIVAPFQEVMAQGGKKRKKEKGIANHSLSKLGEEKKTGLRGKLSPSFFRLAEKRGKKGGKKHPRGRKRKKSQ